MFLNAFPLSSLEDETEHILREGHWTGKAETLPFNR